MFAEDFEDRILPFDETAAVSFSIIAAERRRMGKPISQADTQIASICYACQATLSTRNISDFEGCGIVTINPWKIESSN